LLNAYMLSIVQNAGSGPTVKDLLRQEVEMRAIQKARALVIALYRIANDSTLVDPDSVRYAMLAAHPDPSDFYLLAGIALERGDHRTATDWLDSLVVAKDEDPALLRDLVAMRIRLAGDWDRAENADLAALATMATSNMPGAAMAWAILYHLGATDAVPSPETPSNEKSLRHKPIRTTTNTERPVLEAYPNPTTGTCWAVLTVELDQAALLRVSDPQGRLVQSYRLAMGQQLVELDLSGLANGLYTCELLQGEFKLAVTKLTVQR